MTADTQEELFAVEPPAPKPPHLLTITPEPGRPGQFLYAIECPRVTPHCEAWEEPDHQLTDDEIEEIEQTGQLDGVPHETDDEGVYRRPAGTCWVQLYPAFTEMAAEFAAAEHLGPGTYPVHAEYDDTEPENYHYEFRRAV